MPCFLQGQKTDKKGVAMEDICKSKQRWLIILKECVLVMTCFTHGTYSKFGNLPYSASSIYYS